MSAPAIISSGTAAGGPPVGGTGITNTIPRWTGPSTLGDSVITQNSTALVTAGSASATQTTFRVYTVGTANNAPASSWYRGGVAEFVQYINSAGALAFAANPAGFTDAQLDAAAKVWMTFGGNVGIGTASPASRLDVAGTITCDDAGTGLKLPATPGNTDPNTLDCYADGGTAGGGGKTWTPADTSGAGLTLTVNSAQYVQVGKLVVMTADITYPVTASAAVASLSLPVSPAVNYFHAGSTGYQTTPAIAGLAPMVKNTAMNIWAYDTQQTNAQLSGKRLIFTVSYFMG